MFKVKWDVQNNGVILSDNISDEEAIPAPRPVFLQELQILEIDKAYRLPKTDKPICWNIDTRYYYKGQPFFERRGAGIYTKPTIVYNTEFAFDSLEAIDIEKVVEVNREAIETIENESMDFIMGCYEAYKGKVDDFVVAFSGGKDSQVILDLVTRVLPVELFKTVFQDTDMELPCTYDIVAYTEEDYKYRFPNFKMYHAKSDRKALDLWKQYGPPSRVNRWCCSVMKTTVFRRLMKELHNTDTQPKVAVFEGVRADESARREAYERIGVNVKHPNLINCRAIFRWNNSEIFLYMFSRGIELNPAYRMGLTRVGCGVCPFASDWSEYLIRRIYPDISKKYVAVIEEMARNLGLNSKEKIDNYVSTNNWQKNAGGRGLIPDGSRVDLLSKEPRFECVVTKPKTDWRIWLYALCEYVSQEDNDVIKGEMNFNGELFRFSVEEREKTIRFAVEGTVNKPALHVVQILARIIFESDLKSGEYRFQVPDIGIKNGEGKVSPFLARQEGLLKEGENWGVVTMQYVQPEGREKGYAEMVKFKPFRPYKPDYEYYCQARERFSIEEWVDFLICCMEYNPNSSSFESLDQKLLFLTRLLVFVEPNLNMIELAPKGTGKSYIFNNLSKYGWQISGGKVTRAKLFYDMSKNTPGIIPSYEFVSLDEVKTISFDNPEEIQGALKNYMEQGSFTVGKSKLTSLAGMILLGNIDLDVNRRPINNHYFEELPDAFQDHALIDRFHGFIEGWYLPRISEDIKLNGYSLNVEYFSEILSYSRTLSFYSSIVKEMLEIPKNADTRDTNAIIKMCSGYLKLLYPHVRSVSDISPQEFKMMCFEPAYEKRKIIRQQLAAIDREFTDRMPDITVRGL